MARITTGASNDKKNNVLSSECITGENLNFRLFVHLLDTGKTLVSLAPIEVTLGSFIQAILVEAGLAS